MANNDPMPSPEFATIVAIVFIGGFAIQQLLQIADFPVERFINKKKDANGIIYGVSIKVFKTSLLLFISSLLGVLIAWQAPVILLAFAFPKDHAPDRWLDVLVSGLVIGSGTEAVNTVMKFLGYIKEAQKTSIIDIRIDPLTASVEKGVTRQFRVVVTNGDSSAVDWSVSEGNGGKIDNKGLYTAPNSTGTFHVVAASRQDPSKTSTATVTVINPPA